MNKNIFSLIVFLLLFAGRNVFAVPAIPVPVEVTQPDGSVLTIRLYGDEFFGYATTEDGFLISQNAESEWKFAQIDNDNNIVATEKTAKAKKYLSASELEELENINQSIDIQLFAATKRDARKSVLPRAVAPRVAVTGTMKALVILVNFKDKHFVVPDAQQAFSDLLNQPNYTALNGATGSARDYFIDNSSGDFQPQFDVYGPYTLDSVMSYYGKNVGSYDQDPELMVSNACDLAYAAGVDFTQYDYDGNNVVDQVFIYYAGNNEAEGAPSYTIWPHRSAVWHSVGSGANMMYIYDYACASELRLNQPGPDFMCGIGTFAHEFGHILGLPDFYATNGAGHHTLHYWDIMDRGCYLNGGFTPAGYSSYERFFLGWLMPRMLEAADNVVLSPLNTSNKALMVTKNNTSNFDGANPSPVLFYMLENRQQTGWDSFLPGHGLLLTKINYNATRWANNAVNNFANSMGVEIIAADGLANASTLSGDPFPGAAGVDEYSIVFEENISKPLSEISETDNMIEFKFMGGVSPVENLPAGDTKIFTEKEKLIAITQNADLQTIVILDLLGRQVFSTNFYNNFEIDTSNFPTGIYIVKTGQTVVKVKF
jgi:M6 family metalloprotease-like protein